MLPSHRLPSVWPLVCWLSVGLGAGCAQWQELSPILFPEPEHYSPVVVDEHRRKFQVDSDPESLTWLLGHMVENGMTVPMVNDALGAEGVREFDDSEMKRNGGHYQQTDIGYKWGPDRSGRSVVLFFREGKLVYFDQNEFRH
ncbi:hypothetical protein GC163_15340 [bacterium]|nr:hypothetical protein [bacterium]